MNIEKPVWKLVVFLAVVAIVTCLGIAVDFFLGDHGASALTILFFPNAVSGLIAGALILQHMLREKEKRQIFKDRLDSFSEIHHHVRGVLTAVAFYGTQTGNPYSAEIISECLARVESNLYQMLRTSVLNEPVPEAANATSRIRSFVSGRFTAEAVRVPRMIVLITTTMWLGFHVVPRVC